ncbi:MAG TPA: hypothetical protein VGZ01_03545 [Trinickia sp.]|nr:hypothetical protein [Trinickia sp.]
MKKQAISKAAGVAAFVALAFGASNAFPQEASGVMSNTEAASGTMSKEPMGQSKPKHKHAKKSGSMDMQHGSSGTMGQ